MSDVRPSPSTLGPLRRPAPAVAVVALLIAAVLGVRFAGDPAAGRFDQEAETVVEALTGPHWRWFGPVVLFGSPLSVVFWAVVLAGLALLLRRPRHAVLAIVGPGLTGAATTGLKPLIGRTIDGTGYAYPSGHTGGATSTALVLALLLISLVSTRRAVAVAVVATAALLAGGAVGTGMVTIGAHYPTDTVGGFCLAVAIGLGAGLVIDRIADRRGPVRSPETAGPPPPTPAPG